jgi:hypothetical protein
MAGDQTDVSGYAFTADVEISVAPEYQDTVALTPPFQPSGDFTHSVCSYQVPGVTGMASLINVGLVDPLNVSIAAELPEKPGDVMLAAHPDATQWASPRLKPEFWLSTPDGLSPNTVGVDWLYWASRDRITRLPLAFPIHLPPNELQSEFRALARDDPAVE